MFLVKHYYHIISFQRTISLERIPLINYLEKINSLTEENLYYYVRENDLSKLSKTSVNLR